MKSKINPPAEPLPSEPPYPCLMRDSNNLAVWFRAPKNGIVVHGNKYCALGEESGAWDMSCFTYEPKLSVTLSNI